MTAQWFLWGGGALDENGDPAAWQGDGFSVRLMWYSTNSSEYMVVKAYVYHVDQPRPYGDGFGITAGYVNVGQVTPIKIHAQMNNDGSYNGIVKVFVGEMDNPGLVRRNMRVKDGHNMHLEKFMFSVFAGGSRSDWEIPNTSDSVDPFIEIDDIYFFTNDK